MLVCACAHVCGGGGGGRTLVWKYPSLCLGNTTSGGNNFLSTHGQSLLIPLAFSSPHESLSLTTPLQVMSLVCFCCLSDLPLVFVAMLNLDTGLQSFRLAWSWAKFVQTVNIHKLCKVLAHSLGAVSPFSFPLNFEAHITSFYYPNLKILLSHSSVLVSFNFSGVYILLCGCSTWTVIESKCESVNLNILLFSHIVQFILLEFLVLIDSHSIWCIFFLN